MVEVDGEARRVQRHLVRGARLRMRLPDAMPDESMFFVVALLAGAVCGYLAATV
jgi:hypothetical protein